MKKNPDILKSLIILLCAVCLCPCVMAQPKGMPGNPPSSGAPGAGSMPGMEIDNWEVTINTMDADSREKITSVVTDLHANGGTRGFMESLLLSMGQGVVSSAVEVVATEVINLAKYRKRQKEEWMRMIQNECFYTDSITSIKGLRDFYTNTSKYGALDPSDINFDGISLRGMRNNDEVLYLSCHIDTTRLSHLFQHSKFHLVVDTIFFNPALCHLPNLSANGIRVSGETEGLRDNNFNFSERERLTIGMELNLYSSWINEAVMVHQNVKLGTFKLNVTIPDNVETYQYSRADALKNGKPLVDIEGDCFVVPRSFMPISGTERMWGTGEYTVSVKIRESCQFLMDENRNEKLKNWHDDYKALRKMQKKGSESAEYLRTLWSQNGNTLIKTMVKTGLNTTLQETGVSKMLSGAGGSKGGAAAASGAGAPQALSAPSGGMGAPMPK